MKSVNITTQRHSFRLLDLLYYRYYQSKTFYSSFLSKIRKYNSPAECCVVGRLPKYAEHNVFMFNYIYWQSGPILRLLMLPVAYRHSCGCARNPQPVSYWLCIPLHSVQITICAHVLLAHRCKANPEVLASSKTLLLGLESATLTTRPGEQTYTIYIIE